MPEGLSAQEKTSRTEAPKTPALPPAQANRVSELQVTAHIMTLETGLFCVFQSPGSPAPDPITALPGVRITPAPGLAGRPEAVSVSTFREDGWLNGTAALVRVTDGSAQILVTIYQDKGQDAAPKLQVLRIGGDPAAPAAAPVAAPVAASGTAQAPVARAAPVQALVVPGGTPEMMAHIQLVGDATCAIGEWLGTKGSKQWIEGFGLAPQKLVELGDIEYQAVLGRNWMSPWVEGGKYCGSRGMALPLLGIKVRLKNDAARKYDVTYSATFVDGSAAGPKSNGETCEAESMAALESFQVVIAAREGKAKPADKKAAAKTADTAKPAETAKPAGRSRTKQ